MAKTPEVGRKTPVARPKTSRARSKTREASPDLKTLNKIISPRFQDEERRELATRLKDQFMKDPELLAQFERLIGAHTEEFARVRPTEEELKSFGWAPGEDVMCPAAVVAAAAATWGAAAAQTVRG